MLMYLLDHVAIATVEKNEERVFTGTVVWVDLYGSNSFLWLRAFK